MAGSATVTRSSAPVEIDGVMCALTTIEVAWTADASDGSMPAVSLGIVRGKLLALETDPGATAPTDNYDITITNAAGVDKAQGLGLNRDTATTEQVALLYGSTGIHPIVSEALTFNLTGNSVNSAVGVARLLVLN